MLLWIILALLGAGGGGLGLYFALRKTTTAPVVHSVTLTWTPTETVTGTFNVYRTTVGSIPNMAYTKLNATPIIGNTYIDTTAVVGVQYDYYVTEVINGIESPPSNIDVNVTIP